MRAYIYIAIGGVAGVLLRYQLGVWIAAWNESSFPWATLGINLLGSFLIGIAMRYAFSKGMNADLRLALTTGFCGGFTTLSTFSYELVMLMKEGQLAFAAGYLSATVGLAPLLCYLGFVVVDKIG